jgi:sigma-B regulation protein RsbU (phosphoserine phosphatase)
LKTNDPYQELVVLFDKQLEFAQNLQKKIIPVPGSFISDEYHFYSYLRPFRKVGGDFYDFHFMDDGKISLIMADAAGHGIDAAMITSMIKLSYSYTMKDKSINHSPSLILKQIEHDINQQLDNTFFTAISILLDPQSKTIYYANAGHPAAILIKSNHHVQHLRPNLPMLGLHQFLNSMSYNDLQVKFTKGDKLLLFTDGLVDSKNAAREEFGMDRITKIVKNSFNRPVSQIGGNIINESQKFRGDQPSSDDVCLLGLEVVE